MTPEIPEMIACSGCGKLFTKKELVIYGLIPLLIYCPGCLKKAVLEDEEDEE